MRISSKRGPAVIVSILIALGAAGACSDDDDDDANVEDATAQVCDSRADVSASVQALKTVDPAATTVGELEALRDDVGEAVESLNEAGTEVAAEKMDALQTAYDDFNSAVTDIDDDATLQAAGDDIKTSAAAVGTAFDALYADVDCA